MGNEYFNDGARDHKDVLELLYVGRLAMQKRVERLIAMLPLMTTPSHLTIVGDGDERALLEQKVNELHITNVTFAGKKIGEALIEYYRSADVFVIASDVEGMPLVVLEAMAESLPVVATNVLGLRELVKDTGILIDTPYEEGFAKEIDRLGSDTELRAALGRKSFGKAAQFTWKNAVDHMITLYQYHD